MINKVLYLGPTGSYSEIAKDKFKECFASECEFIALESIYKIIRKLQELDSEDVAAVIPIENSIEGVVRETQDNLAALAKIGFRIQAETFLSVEHSLISFGDKKDIKKILSHPQALAQCRDYIFKNFGDDVKLEAVLSTSTAVQALSNENKEEAAIANQYCANIYDVPIIESRINDEKNNTTRFILVSKIAPTVLDSGKVSITFSTENKPGALNRVLNVFEKYGLNMTYIDSRPSRKEMGEYVFYVDFIGHTDISNTTLALTEIQAHVRMFEILSEGANCV